jgi:hypothetical protein
MKCILHIGTEKTGTTSLQNFLVINRQALSQHGYLYPRSAGPKGYRTLAAAAYDSDRRDDLTKNLGIRSDAALRSYQASVLAQLRAELQQTSGIDTTIFSSEHFQSRLTRESELQRLKDIVAQLGFSEVSVLVYLRNPVEIANSLYTTSVRKGSTAGNPPGPDNAYWRNICDHRETLVRWREVFGRDAIVPRIYNLTESVNDSTIDDFMTRIGLPLSQTSFVMPERKNEGMTHTGLEILRRVNRQVPVFMDDGTPNRMRKGIEKVFAAHMTFGKKYGLPETLRRQYEEAFLDSNEWVRAEYFPDRQQLFEAARVPPPSECRLENSQLDQIADLVSEIWKSRRWDAEDTASRFDKLLKSLRRGAAKIVTHSGKSPNRP